MHVRPPPASGPPPAPGPPVASRAQGSSSFSEVDIFENGKHSRTALTRRLCFFFFLYFQKSPDKLTVLKPTVLSSEEQLSLQCKLSHLILDSMDPRPCAQSPPQTLDQLEEHCFRWILDDPSPPQDQDTCTTAILTSRPLANCLKRHVDPSTITAFQHFLLSSTLTHIGWRDSRPPPQRLSLSDLHRVACTAGSALLRSLDDLLLSSSRRADRPAARPALQAHFVLLFGTILGIAYQTRHQSEALAALMSSILAPVHRDSPTRWLVAQEELRRRLAYELVVLGKALRPDLDAGALARLETAALGQWSERRERWTWVNMILSEDLRNRDPGRSRGPVVDTGGSIFCSAPHASMIARPEAPHAELPRPDGADPQKRRSMIVVGPWEGQQVYARMRSYARTGCPRMMV